MNAEFNWWLLIVGLVVGAGLVWLVLLDSRRREDEVDATERPIEAAWLSAALADEGTSLAPAVAERVLQLHAEYLATSSPPERALIPQPDPEPALEHRVLASETGGAAPSPARLPEPGAAVDPGDS